MRKFIDSDEFFGPLKRDLEIKQVRQLNGNGKTYRQHESIIKALFEKATDKRDEAKEEIKMLMNQFTLEEWIMIACFFIIPFLLGFVGGMEYANHIWQGVFK